MFLFYYLQGSEDATRYPPYLLHRIEKPPIIMLNGLAKLLMLLNGR